jgi:hypothetical protein
MAARPQFRFWSVTMSEELRSNPRYRMLLTLTASAAEDRLPGCVTGLQHSEKFLAIAD